MRNPLSARFGRERAAVFLPTSAGPSRNFAYPFYDQPENEPSDTAAALMGCGDDYGGSYGK